MVTPKGLRLYKDERLCGVTAIDALFAPQSRVAGVISGTMAYPWRAVWRVNPRREGCPARFVIMVPKKRLRRAVDRVAMRRRCREAYRLNRHLLPSLTTGVDIAFVFVGSQLVSYEVTRASMVRMLGRVADSLVSQS